MKVDNQVLAVLSRADTAGNALSISEVLDRKLYERTNKVLEAAGGKWDRKARAHLFPGAADSAIEQIILSGEITIPQDFDYYPTPDNVAAHLVELANITPGMTALEPSAGRGAIAKALSLAGCDVYCIELLPDNVEVLRGMNLQAVLVGDFLEIPNAGAAYDRIVMNPPFTRQADIRHVNHAIKFLKPDGLLVAVMSAAVTFRTNKLTEEFRSTVSARGGTIVPLPAESFKASGTSVNTCVVVIPGAKT